MGFQGFRVLGFGVLGFQGFRAYRVYRVWGRAFGVLGSRVCYGNGTRINGAGLPFSVLFGDWLQWLFKFLEVTLLWPLKPPIDPDCFSLPLFRLKANCNPEAGRHPKSSAWHYQRLPACRTSAKETVGGLNAHNKDLVRPI